MIECEVRCACNVLRHRPVNDLSLRICKRARHRDLVNPTDRWPIRCPAEKVRPDFSGASPSQLCKARFAHDDNTKPSHNPKVSPPNVYVHTMPQNETLALFIQFVPSRASI